MMVLKLDDVIVGIILILMMIMWMLVSAKNLINDVDDDDAEVDQKDYSDIIINNFKKSQELRKLPCQSHVAWKIKFKC